MRKGAGPGRTRDDHLDLAAQLLASLSRSQQVRELAELVGVEALSAADLAFVDFADQFERNLLAQRPDEKRSLAETLDLAWSVALALPDRDLTMLPPAMLAAHRETTVSTSQPTVLAGQPGR
jgi:V/A-type H+-transporting ATPase subunit B